MTLLPVAMERVNEIFAMPGCAVEYWVELIITTKDLDDDARWEDLL